MPSTGVLVALAIIPAVIIIIFIYLKDKVEKEPIGLLAGLFIMGATISVIGAVAAEYALEKALVEAVAKGSTVYNFIMCFLIVALSEEGFKFLVLRLKTWKHKEFNYTFDAIVYAVVVSLGFATLENILYVVDEGTYYVALVRGILSVPGHAIDAVFMGLFFGRAKYCQCCGDNGGKSKNMFLSMFVPVLTHGFYDFCLFTANDTNNSNMMIVFYAFEIVVTIAALVLIHNSSKKDTTLPGMGVPFWQFPSYPYNYYAAQQQQFQQQYSQPYQQYGQQQGYFTPNGYTQPNTSYQYPNYGQNNQQNYQQPYQNYPQGGFVQQGQQYYDQNGYPQQSPYQGGGFPGNYNGQQ